MLCERRDGCPGLPVPNGPYGFCECKATLNCSLYDLWGRKATLNHSISELKSCVKVEVAVLDSQSQIVLMFSVDVKQR